MAGPWSSLYKPGRAIRLAAPSWVVPGTIAQNVLFLLNKVDEIGLCFFEWQSCLKYSADDLPPWLGQAPFSWHAHLPLDLPWGQGAEKVAAICCGLLEKMAFLGPHCLILHPPGKNAAKLLEEFAKLARRKMKIKILLENTPGCEPGLFSGNFLAANGLGLCLDIGHALGYSCGELERLAAQADMAHWSAPGAGDRHLSLARLTRKQKELASLAARAFRPGITHMLEIFNWRGFKESLPVLANLLPGVSMGD